MSRPDTELRGPDGALSRGTSTRSTEMGIRVVASIVVALVLLGMTSMASQGQPDQETPKAKLAPPRDEIDKILEESKQNKTRAIDDIKKKVNEISKKHDDLLYELINARAKLRRAVQGLQELDPDQEIVPDKTEKYEDNSATAKKRHVLRPRPRPKDAREKAEILQRLEAEASLVSELHSELEYMIKYVTDYDNVKK